MSQAIKEGNILLALQALQNDPKLSLRRAAKHYNVDHRRLSDRRKGIRSRHDIIPNSRKLSDLEEQMLLQSIIDLDSRGFPPQIHIVEDMANRLLAARDAPPVGKRWATNFIERQPELKKRFPRTYDYKRAYCTQSWW
jgi:hypothetical protein